MLSLVHHEGDTGQHQVAARGGQRLRLDRDEWAKVCARNKPKKEEG
jgi:hypothetical protein